MNSNTTKLIVTLGLGAALALPSTALARHGADDSSSNVGEHSTEVETHANGTEDNHAATGEAETEHQGAGEQAEPHHGGRSAQGAQQQQKVRTEVYELRGNVVSTDPATETVVIQVKKSNHGRRGRAFIGQSLTVDVTNARLKLDDVNGDGARDLGDVAQGDRVEVRVRLPRSQPTPLTDPVAAERFADRDARA